MKVEIIHVNVTIGYQYKGHPTWSMQGDTIGSMDKQTKFRCDSSCCTHSTYDAISATTKTSIAIRFQLKDFIRAGTGH